MIDEINQMSDCEFLKTFYKKILRRDLDEASRDHYLNEISAKNISRERFLLQLILCEEFELKMSSQEFVHPGHFYSAVPSVQERNNFCNSEKSYKDQLDGINLNKKYQNDLLYKFIDYHNQCLFPHEKNDKFRYYFNNDKYTYSDGLTLYSMIRNFNPKKIIEIGSGFSSCVILDTNDHYFNSNIDVKLIEPYPESLFKLIKSTDHKNLFAEEKLQNIDINIFSSLEKNDILFIDSTHVSKLNSDVNKIVFEILPILQSGVIIHFHDIFWPFEYPKNWIQEGRAWNEAYILHAFLKYNEKYEIIFFSDYIHKFHQNFLQDNLPLYLNGPGGNLWIRKS